MKSQFQILLLMIEGSYQLRHYIQAPRITIEESILHPAIEIMIKMKVLSALTATKIIYPNNASL